MINIKKFNKKVFFIIFSALIALCFALTIISNASADESELNEANIGAETNDTYQITAQVIDSSGNPVSVVSQYGSLTATITFTTKSGVYNGKAIYTEEEPPQLLQYCFGIDITDVTPGQEVSGELSIEKEGYAKATKDLKITGNADLGYVVLIKESDTFSIVGQPGSTNPEYKYVEIFTKKPTSEGEMYTLVDKTKINYDGSFLFNSVDTAYVDGTHDLWLQVSNDFVSPTEATRIPGYTTIEEKKIYTYTGSLDAAPYDQRIIGNSEGYTFNVVRKFYDTKGQEIDRKKQTFIPSFQYGFRNDYLQEFISDELDENNCVKYSINDDNKTLIFQFIKDGNLQFSYEITSNDPTKADLDWCIDHELIPAGEAALLDIKWKHKFYIGTPSGHVLELFPEVPATLTECGIKAYYYCTDCGKYFEDELGYNEIENLDEWKSGAGKIDDWKTQYQNYKNDIMSKLNNSIFEEDTDDIKTIINDAITSIDDLDYDESISLEANKSIIDNIYNEAMSNAFKIREELNSEKFVIYKVNATEQFKSVISDDMPQKVVDRIKDKAFNILALTYNPSISVSDNHDVVDSSVKDGYDEILKDEKAEITTGILALKQDGDPQAVLDIINENKQTIDDYVYDVEKSYLDNVKSLNTLISIEEIKDDIKQARIDEFDNEKNNTVDLLEALKQEGDPQAIDDIISIAKSLVADCEYSLDSTYAQNVEKLNKILTDAESAVKNKRIESYNNMKPEFIVKLEALREDDDTQEITDIINNAIKQINDCTYDENKTYSANIGILQGVFDSAEKNINDIRNEQAFEENKEAQIKNLYDMIQSNDSEEVKSIINNAIDKIKALKYNSDLTLEDNIKIVDKIVEEAKIAVDQQRSSESAESSNIAETVDGNAAIVFILVSIMISSLTILLIRKYKLEAYNKQI